MGSGFLAEELLHFGTHTHTHRDNRQNGNRRADGVVYNTEACTALATEEVLLAKMVSGFLLEVPLHFGTHTHTHRDNRQNGNRRADGVVCNTEACTALATKGALLAKMVSMDCCSTARSCSYCLKQIVGTHSHNRWNNHPTVSTQAGRGLCTEEENKTFERALPRETIN
jgi:hypothetical protein